MHKIQILIFTGVFLFLGCNMAEAGVFINEIQIGGTTANDEFIELYNSSDISQDLTDWSIKKKSSTGVKYVLVSSIRIKEKTISANGYFLLTNENGYTGSAQSDATWASSNTIASDNAIFLYNANGDLINSVGWGSSGDCENVCASNPANGESIQKTGNGWIVSSHTTPGVENEILENIENNENNNQDEIFYTNDSGNNESDSNSASGNETTIESVVNKTKIIVKIPAFVGTPVEFKVNNTVSGNPCGKYFWNFGDGYSEETKKESIIPQKYTHIYEYEGEYVVSLECFRSYLSSESDTSDKITIKVARADISISKTGDEKDFFVEISNNTSLEADISEWTLVSAWKKFIFPKNSILRPKNKIIVSAKITDFSTADKDTLKLLNSRGETIFDYSSSGKPVLSVVDTYIPLKVATAENKNLSEFAHLASNLVPADDKNAEIPVENLLAQAVENDAQEKNNSKYWIFGLLVFLGISASGVHFIRRYKRQTISKTTENDFDIMDE